jgi:hypothetical protein
MRILDIQRDKVFKIRYDNEEERQRIRDALAVLGVEIEELKHTG